MSTLRPIVLTIAGLDPTGGAGTLADIKTIENHSVLGLAVITANTIQTEENVLTVSWEKQAFVVQQLTTLLNRYKPDAVKIGVIPNSQDLLLYINLIKDKYPTTKIVWDPVFKATGAFEFTDNIEKKTLFQILNQIDIITPNYLEIHDLVQTNEDAIEKARQLSQHCTVILKGGHNENALGFDYLIHKQNIQTFAPKKLSDYPKHGSGCVLSSAIAANLALGEPIEYAMYNAKRYMEKYLESNHTLLGYHAI
ncbi:hydroxymethylpyrimidine/phosphomethylpyrimidine kinase [Myroides phaeus]|uniref:hydroxymethylpyrimidine kinase n=1 Tax=Myroides phaeus TaxID=702745 RepID=A0A1G8FWG1_9FLAO|nr:hydroxymethylpyrimidine/phosphomethylpyrimidine kinase [Myroides phaeus]MEC4115413.1 hydroxymethylpyrimidine/phosphomethylpyrimidine kinase [Myroides phaeus]SDH86473.1 hydroxymethylpyrimidine/phosphomethylpyrimidine kinase [Myroides phaeus]